jgi:prepilin-type processing-associated H-X9-DG protein
MPAMETEMKTQRTMRGGEGFTSVELLVVICVVAAVVALLLPALAAAKRKTSRVGCINNLEQDCLAFKMWSGDNSDKYPTQVSVTNGGAMEMAFAGDVAGIFCDMTNELPTPRILVCPEDPGRHYATNFTTDFNNQKISYFVGLDAAESYPQMILLGDDNLAVNGVRVRPGILNLWTNASVGWTAERTGQFHGAGNVAFADGSAAQMSSSYNLATVGMTNRLVIP